MRRSSLRFNVTTHARSVPELRNRAVSDKKRRKSYEEEKQCVAQLRAELSAPHLLSKAEVMAITGRSYPTIWKWMRDGKFPRSRIVGDQSMWRSDEVYQWRDTLPLRPLKGDEAGNA